MTCTALPVSSRSAVQNSLAAGEFWCDSWARSRHAYQAWLPLQTPAAEHCRQNNSSCPAHTSLGCRGLPPYITAFHTSPAEPLQTSAGVRKPVHGLQSRAAGSVGHSMAQPQSFHPPRSSMRPSGAPTWQCPSPPKISWRLIKHSR